MAQHLLSNKSDFSELERAVLSALCEIQSADRAAIEARAEPLESPNGGGRALFRSDGI